MRGLTSAPVPAVSRPAAAVVFALVGPLKGAGSLTPVSVVSPLMPVLLGSIRMIPGFALRTRSWLFPFVTMSICTLQLLPAVFGLHVWWAMIVVSARAAAVAAGPASRSWAVRPRQAPPIIVVPPRSVRSRPWLCSWPRSTGTSAASTSLAFFSHAIVRALRSLLSLFWLFFNGFGIQRYWTLVFSFQFSRGS